MLSFNVPYESVLLLVILCGGSALITVLLRMYVRAKLLTTGVQTWILATLIFYMAFCINAVTFAIAEHSNPVFTEENGDVVLQALIRGECLFMLSSVLLRVSLTITFRNFLVQKWQRQVVLYCGCSVCLFSGVASIVSLFQCGLPVNLVQKNLHGGCIPEPIFAIAFYCHGALSALTDWTFALLPVFAIYNSMMPRAQKISVSILVAFACLGSVAAVVRTAVSGTLGLKQHHFDPTRRPTYYQAISVIVDMAIVELGVGITAISGVCLRPLVVRLFGRLGTTRSATDTNSSRTPKTTRSGIRLKSMDLHGKPNVVAKAEGCRDESDSVKGMLKDVNPSVIVVSSEYTVHNDQEQQWEPHQHC